ncbi:MAG TPA: hypothetical protein VGK74_29335 [Symbiobacteriaceae bacterium]
MVDAVDQVLTAPAGAIAPPPEGIVNRLDGVDGIAKVGESLIVLLNREAVLKFDSAKVGRPAPASQDRPAVSAQGGLVHSVGCHPGRHRGP